MVLCLVSFGKWMLLIILPLAILNIFMLRWIPLVALFVPLSKQERPYRTLHISLEYPYFRYQKEIRFVDALFLEATDVVFLDELFFYRCIGVVCFCIDLQGDLKFIFTSSFSIKFYI